MLTSKTRFAAQNWSQDQKADRDALKAAKALLESLPEGRIVAAQPGSLLVEAVAPRSTDVENFRRRLEQALPGWSVYPETNYRLT